MTTYLFMLTPEIERVLVERVTHQLAERFPEHEFVAGGADIPDFENSILAIHATAGSGELAGILKATDVAEIARERSILRYP